MLGVVVSRADDASVTIGEHLLELGSWRERVDQDRPDADGGGTYYRSDDVELRTFDPLHLELADVATAFDQPSLLAFASRHSGETGPLLTAHTSGNVGRAEFGGAARSLPAAAPNALRSVRRAFATHAPDGYGVGIECTHHGPSVVGCPSLFVELGSGPDEWDDPAGAAAVARSILELRDVPPRHPRTVVGFGGGHYAPRFDRVLAETDWRVGHVAADWALAELGDPHEARAVVRAMFARSGAELALLDVESPALEAVIEDLGFRTVTETWLRETDGVPLETVEHVEAHLPAEGLRFGEPATSTEGAVVAVELPADLLAEAAGIDREATVAVLADVAVGYRTETDGTPTPDVVLADATERRRIVHGLAGVLVAKYDDVTVEDDAVVAVRTAFDPALARAAGVEEGPAFGRLADGDAVEVGGKTVTPEAVRSARERRFPR